MDPLSITASVLTLVSAVAECIKRIQILRDAPQEILVLANEISELEIVINEVAKSLEDQRQRPRQTVEKLNNPCTGQSRDNVSKLLRRVEGCLAELMRLNEKLVTVDSDNGKVKFAGIAWLKCRSKVEGIRKTLSATKLSLTTALVATTSTNVNKILLRLENITLVTGNRMEPPNAVEDVQIQTDIQTLESTDRSAYNRNALEEAPVLEAQTANEASATAVTRQSPTYKSAENVMLDTMFADSSSVIQVHTTKSGCPRWCSCTCHKPGRLRSPQLLNQVMGAISVGY